MRNEYRGICYRCGFQVDAGKGHFERVGRSHRQKWPSMPFGVKWLTQHADCAIRWRGSARHYLHAPDAKEAA